MSTAIWGLVVVFILGSLVVRVLLEGIDGSLAQDLRDDLLPFLALFVSFVVFPGLVFFWDLWKPRGQGRTRNQAERLDGDGGRGA